MTNNNNFKSVLLNDKTYLKLLEKNNNNELNNRTDVKIFQIFNEINQRKFIYKYLKPSYGVNNFINNLIYYSQPFNFNDIRDCSLKQVDFTDRYIADLVNSEIATYSPYERSIILSKLKDKRERKIIYNNFKKGVKESALNDLGVSCFTGSPSNEVMWGVYAQNYEGIVIQFDFEKLVQYFTELNIATFVKVDYLVDLNKLVYDLGVNLVDITIDMVSRKSKQWEYEDEIRAIMSPINNPIVQIQSSLITAVFLGNRMAPESKNKVIEDVKTNKPHCKVYEIDLDDDLNLGYKEIGL